MSILISSGYCVTLALMILLLPLGWIIPALIAAFVHELCHYAAILLCTGQTTGFSVYSFAARIELPPMGKSKELICALAGPLGGGCLWLLSPWFPRLAICAVLQSAYNLLPIYPLDGGRALRCTLEMMLPPAAAAFAAAFIQWAFLGMLAVLAIYAAFVLHGGLMPVFVVLVLLFRTKDRKMPCKPAPFAVQ